MDFLPMLIYAAVSYITPGPNNIMSMYLGANYGLGGSKPFIIGSSLSHLVKACLCGGLNIVLAQVVPDVLPYIKWIGVAYLVYLSIHIIIDGFKGKGAANDKGGDGGTSATYKSGIMLQVLNIKSWISCLSVFSVYVVPYTTAFSQIALSVLTIQLLMTGSTLIWVLFGGTLKSFYSKHIRLFSIIMAALLLWCAVTAVI